MGWLFGITFFTFIIVFVLSMALLNRQPAVTAEGRLQEIERFYRGHKPDAVAKAEPTGESFYERVLQPLTEEASTRFQFLSNVRPFKWMEEKLRVAGLSTQWDPWEFFVMWCGLILAGGAIGLLLASTKNMSLVRFLMTILLGLALGAYSVPFYLYSRIKKRQKEIRRTLPDILDMLTVSVEAGLSFDGALAKLAEKMHGPLVDELTRVLQEMRMGITRKSALVAMAKRCDVEDLSLFVSAIVQADQLGVGVARVLRIQAAEARDKRRLLIREQAMKAPIKMLFPLVFFIFPALFVVVLGPAAISLLHSLGK